MQEEYRKDYAWVRASTKSRLRILESVEEYPKTQTDLQRELNIKLSNLNPEFKDLEDRGLIECVDERIKKSKHYIATERGKKILGLIREVERDVRERTKLRRRREDDDEMLDRVANVGNYRSGELKRR